MKLGSLFACMLLVVAMPALAADVAEDKVVVDGLEFSSWSDYVQSDYFKAAGGRCGTPGREVRAALYSVPEFLETPDFFDTEGSDGADCSASSTNPTSQYDPMAVYRIPTVVHVIMNDAGTQGVISDELVQSQIDILNEDFQALAGSNGENGVNSLIEFYLATEDPDGDPTNGITRSNNTTWFNDGGAYWNTLAWDPNRYLNIYTNSASGALGYVPFLPADGNGTFVGGASDRVVVLWNSFGRDAPIGPPFNQGRTGTHELGHYLGLEHVFSGSCGTSSCYTTGDLICDTEPDQTSHFGCPTGATSCGGERVPVENYMEYTDDLCMELFTTEQMRRMRCTLENWRPNLYEIGTAGGDDIFTDGFESGNTTSWSASLP